MVQTNFKQDLASSWQGNNFDLANPKNIFFLDLAKSLQADRFDQTNPKHILTLTSPPGRVNKIVKNIVFRILPDLNKLIILS